jgi:hypothetical protein
VTVDEAVAVSNPAMADIYHKLREWKNRKAWARGFWIHDPKRVLILIEHTWPSGWCAPSAAVDIESLEPRLWDETKGEPWPKYAG